MILSPLLLFFTLLYLHTTFMKHFIIDYTMYFIVDVLHDAYMICIHFYAYAISKFYNDIDLNYLYKISEHNLECVMILN